MPSRKKPPSSRAPRNLMDDGDGDSKPSADGFDSKPSGSKNSKSDDYDCDNDGQQ